MTDTRTSPRSAASADPLGLPLAGLVAAMFSTQWGASLAKALFPAVGIMGAAAYRITFAALFLAVALRPWRARLTLGNSPPVLVYGVALGTMNLCFYQAISTIPLGIAVTIEFIGPLGVAILASRQAIDFLWALAAVAGLALLAPWNPEASHALNPTGIAWALGAAVGWGTYIIAGREASRVHGSPAVALGMAIAALMALPIGIGLEGERLINPFILPLVLAVAFFGSALPYTLELFALRRIPTKTFGTLMSLEPAVAALVGYLWLHEALAPRHWVALAAIMTASAGATWTASRAARAS